MGTRSCEKMYSLYSITYYWNWSILATYSLPTNTFPSTWMEVHHICKVSSRCGKNKIIVNIACVKHLTTSMSVSMKRSVIQSLSLSLTILTISQQNDRKENLKANRTLGKKHFFQKKGGRVGASGFVQHDFRFLSKPTQNFQSSMSQLKKNQ